MKTCPVCRSLCFDDMPICYGCMHSFSRDGSHDVGSTEADPAGGNPANHPADSKGPGKVGDSSASPLGMRIPMITSVLPSPRPDETARIPRQMPTAVRSTAHEPMPSLAVEVPAGFRAVFRLEPLQ